MDCTAAAPAIDVERHRLWARSIARGVRADFRFLAGSQEEKDLEGAADLALVLGAQRFDPSMVPDGGDPGGQFQGWLARDIRTSCQREAYRLRNGGTFRTTRTPTLAPAACAAVPDDDLATEVRRRSSTKRTRGEGTALPLSDDGDQSFRLLPAGLLIEGELDLPEWAAAIGRVVVASNSMLWALGDLVIWGVARFGADAHRTLAESGYASETARVAERVCRKFPVGMRIPNLTFNHHSVVSALPIKQARRLLRRAAEERLSTRALRELVRKHRPAPVADHARRLHTVAATLPRLDQVTRARLRDLASLHGVPFAGDQWPALDAILAALAGLKAERAA